MSGNGEQEEDDPNLDVEESWVSGDKDGASPEGASNWSDSFRGQNEEGTGTNGGNGTASTEYAFAVSSGGSSVEPPKWVAVSATTLTMTASIVVLKRFLVLRR